MRPGRINRPDGRNPDGVNNWCDAAYLVIDSPDAPHVLFYKRTAGADHLYYWKGKGGLGDPAGLPGGPRIV